MMYIFFCFLTTTLSFLFVVFFLLLLLLQRTLYIAGVADSSLLQQKENKIVSKGYWWEHARVPTEKDDDDNINLQMPMTQQKWEDINYLIKQAGLTSSYSEHFACPRSINSDSIFTTIRFVYRNPHNNAVSITSLSGCVLKEELNVPFIGCSDKVTRGAWIYRAKELLPGPRFDQVHVELKEWWYRVEKLCEAASMSDEVLYYYC
jgi:hypothetical protein